MSTDAIILRDFTAGTVVAADDFAIEKKRILDACAAVVRTDTPEGMALARDAKNNVADLRNLIEKRRKEVKAPVIALGKAIDEYAATLTTGIETAENRLDSMIKSALKEQAEREAKVKREQEAEAARIAAAAQRAAREAAALQLQQEEAKAREEKAIADAQKALAYAARLKDGEAKAAAQKAAQDAEEAANKARAESEDISERQLAAEIAAEETAGMAPTAPQPVAVHTKGVKGREVWEFELLGANEFDRQNSLLDLGKKHPHLVNIEARRSAILDMINRQGVRELPGLRIFNDIRVSVR